MKYRIREYGPKSSRFFQPEFQDEGDEAWYCFHLAPSFCDLKSASDWLDGYLKPNPPEIIHPYPDETTNKPLS